MSQFEILPIVEKYYPLKFLVIIITWTICKIAKTRRLLVKSDKGQLCVIVLHKIGDSVFTIHAIKKIVEFHQEEIITIICFPETKPIYQIAFPEISLVAIPHNHFWKARIATKDARKIFRGLKPEIIYDLTGAITSASLIASTRAKKIIGMNLEYFKSLYDDYIPLRTKPHLIDMYMDVVRQVQPVGNDTSYEFPHMPTDSGKVLIHPHAGWAAKEWGIDKYIELAKKLSTQYNVEFVVEINSISKEIRAKIESSFILTETKSVEDLIENTKSCAVLIGNDSGPVHIASLLGRPTIAIYGPTNPNYCKPFGKHHEVIRQEVSCSPVTENYCFTDAGRKCTNFICMRNLGIETVYYKVIDFINSIN